jgi:hypothetical protein
MLTIHVAIKAALLAHASAILRLLQVSRAVAPLNMFVISTTLLTSQPLMLVFIAPALRKAPYNLVRLDVIQLSNPAPVNLFVLANV